MRAVLALSALSFLMGSGTACNETGDDGRNAGGPGAGEPGCTDRDGDGHGLPACGGDDCDDRAQDVFPGAEDPAGDGVDASCDGVDGVDADHDGYVAAPDGDDCDDADPTVSPGQVEEQWQFELIAEDGDTGHNTRIAVDPDGGVHVSFADLTGQRIVHGVRVDGAWQLETAVSGSFSAHDFVVDADGIVHLCYAQVGADWSSSSLSCGSRRDGEWTFATVDAVGWTGVDPSLRMTQDGLLHVLYATIDGPHVTLRHAVGDGETWTTEDVDDGGGRESSVAVDQDGALHVAFVGVDGSVRAATNADGGAWAVEVVDDGPSAQGPTVVLGASDATYVAYDRGGAEVLWATRSARGWRTESVAESSTGASPAFVAGVLDPLGSVHLFFPHSDDEAWGLGYATNHGGSWQTEIVDLDSTGQFSAATVHAGQVYVAYLGGNGSDGDALFATRGAPDGVDSNCDGAIF